MQEIFVIHCGYAETYVLRAVSPLLWVFGTQNKPKIHVAQFPWHDATSGRVPCSPACLEISPNVSWVVSIQLPSLPWGWVPSLHLPLLTAYFKSTFLMVTWLSVIPRTHPTCLSLFKRLAPWHRSKSPLKFWTKNSLGVKDLELVLG